jgi:hypothetical protein
MLGYKQRNIRVAACLLTGGTAFFVTLQLLTPAPDAPPSKSKMSACNGMLAWIKFLMI